MAFHTHRSRPAPARGSLGVRGQGSGRLGVFSSWTGYRVLASVSDPIFLRRSRPLPGAWVAGRLVGVCGWCQSLTPTHFFVLGYLRCRPWVTRWRLWGGGCCVVFPSSCAAAGMAAFLPLRRLQPGWDIYAHSRATAPVPARLPGSVMVVQRRFLGILGPGISWPRWLGIVTRFFVRGGCARGWLVPLSLMVLLLRLLLS